MENCQRINSHLVNVFLNDVILGDLEKERIIREL